MTGPLAGTRVIELSAIGPGPFAGMMLADLGADVIRVDRAGSERPFQASHRVLDRGRRSIAVDLKQPEGVDVVLDLMAGADVLLEGFRPGVTERLGLGPEVALERNPRLVYARITGWGQDGPLAQRAGHDINYIALSGALHPIPGPTPPLNLLGDFGAGGMLAITGILAALLHVQRTGQGQIVDAAIVDGTALLTAMHQSMRSSGDWDSPRGENLFDGGAPFYGIYSCADGESISVGAIEPQFYAQLLDGLGLSEQLATVAQDDRSSWPRVRRLFCERFAQRTRDEWAQIFEGTDACVAEVLSPEEAPSNAHLAARGIYQDVDGLTHPAPAPRYSATPAELPGRAPRGGEHTREVLAEIGWDRTRVQDLLERAVVQA